MSDAWFSKEILPEGPDGDPEDGCHPTQAQALKDYYHKKTSAKEAAQAITQSTIDSEDPGDNSYRLWGLLTNALVELPAAHTPALIQLLDAIQNLPEPDMTARRTTERSWDGFRRDLVNFGHMWADCYKSDNWRPDLAASDPANRAELRAEHIKRADIEARLTVADVGIFPMDWAYECMADALEHRSAGLDFEVPAAARWIAIVGNQMYAGAVGGEESWALKRPRDFGKESSAMSLERWAFWKKRLGELAQQCEAVRIAAEGAVREMEALERNSPWQRVEFSCS